MRCVIYHIVLFLSLNSQIEEAFPETRRFKGQWAIDRTVKQFWDNHKTYRSCVNNELTYRGRQVAARRAAV
jgi:hypothetical protein